MLEEEGKEKKGDTWWRIEEGKEAGSWKTDTHKAMCQDNSEENKRRYKSMTNKTKKQFQNQ